MDFGATRYPSGGLRRRLDHVHPPAPARDHGPPVLGEDPGHAAFASDYSDWHRCASVQLDLHVHPGGQIQLHQGVHGLVRGIEDVENALVGSDGAFLVIVEIAMPIRCLQGEIMGGRFSPSFAAGRNTSSF